MLEFALLSVHYFDRNVGRSIPDLQEWLEARDTPMFIICLFFLARGSLELKAPHLEKYHYVTLLCSLNKFLCGSCPPFRYFEGPVVYWKELCSWHLVPVIDPRCCRQIIATFFVSFAVHCMSVRCFGNYMRLVWSMKLHSRFAFASIVHVACIVGCCAQ